MSKSKKTFSLIELIIIFVILAILAILFALLASYLLKKSRNSQRMADIGQISSSIQTYYGAYFNYPMPNNAVQISDYSGTLGVMAYQGVFDESVRKIGIPINKVPLDPTDNLPYIYTRIDLLPKGIEIAGLLEQADFGKFDMLDLPDRTKYVSTRYNTGDFGIFPMGYISIYQKGVGFITANNIGTGAKVLIDPKNRNVYDLTGSSLSGYNTGDFQIPQEVVIQGE